jgi:hypothetical protein
LTDQRSASKLVPGLALGGVDAIWNRELNCHRSFQLASAPETQRVVDDSATVQVWMVRHIRIDTGKQVRIERGRNLGAAS